MHSKKCHPLLLPSFFPHYTAAKVEFCPSSLDMAGPLKRGTSPFHLGEEGGYLRCGLNLPGRKRSLAVANGDVRFSVITYLTMSHTVTRDEVDGPSFIHHTSKSQTFQCMRIPWEEVGGADGISIAGLRLPFFERLACRVGPGLTPGGSGWGRAPNTQCLHCLCKQCALC